MKELVLGVLQEAGFLGLFSMSLFLLLAPLLLSMEAHEKLSSRRFRDPRAGLLYLCGAAAVVVFDVWLVIWCGPELWHLLSASFGPWIVGLLIAAICVVAYPICAVGSHFRLVYEAKSRHIGSPQARRSLFIGLAGLAAIAVITILLLILAPIEVVLGFGFLVGVALVVGWFGHILVPDLE